MKNRLNEKIVVVLLGLSSSIALGACPAHALLQVDPAILDEQYRTQATEDGASSTHACTVNPALINERFIRSGRTERAMLPGQVCQPDPAPLPRASLQSFELTAAAMRF